MSALRGRPEAVATVASSIAAAVAGRGRTVIVVGVPGSGRTRMLGEARQQAHERGMTILAASAHPTERDLPGGLVDQLLSPDAGPTDAGPTDAGPTDARPTGAEPTDTGPTDAEPTDAGRTDAAATTTGPADAAHHRVLLDAVRALDVPVLVTVDDVHWADRESLDALLFLALRVSDLPVALVIATDGPLRGSDLADLLPEETTTALALDPLDAAAAADLVRDVAGPDVSAAVVDACVHQCGGSPTLLVGMATDAAAGIASFVERRLRHAGPAARTLAEAVAVLDGAGGPFVGPLVAGLDPTEATSAWDRLIVEGLFVAGPNPAFAQPIVRTAVLAAIPFPRRGELHARAARILIDRAARPSVLAPHLVGSSEPVGAEGARVLVRAARAALDEGRSAEALTLLVRADAETVDAATRADLRRMLAVAAVRTHGIAEIGRFDDADTSAPGLPERIAVALDRAEALDDLGLPDGARQTLDDAAALIPGDPDRANDPDDLRGRDGPNRVLALRIAVRRATLIAYPDQHRHVLPRLATTAAELSPDGPLERALLCAHAYGELVDGRREAAGRTVTTALVDADDAGAIDVRALELGLRTAIRTDRVDLAREVIGAELARGPGDRGRSASAMTLRALIALDQGTLADAEADARSALGLVPPSGRRSRIVASSVLVLALVARGALEDADRAVAAVPPEVLALAGPAHDELDVATAVLRTAQGRSGEAVTRLETVLPRATAAAYRDVEVLLAEALLADGRRARARAEAQACVVRARVDDDDPTTLGCALRVLGCAESGPRAVRTLTDAVERLRGSPARLELASALVDLGAALRLDRRRADARPVLREGQERAEAAGAVPLAQRARDELSATGRRVRRGAELERDALTPSEQRVAALAAQGRTNRQIAQTLFVTTKTVEMHLSSVYRKLGINDRRGLSAQLPAPDSPSGGPAPSTDRGTPTA